MRICAIGDIHGSDIWKDIVKRNQDSDLYIFLGDYVDSFDINTEDILNNLIDIIDFKLDNPDKVILLLGNHDFQYIYPFDRKYLCSGFRSESVYDFYDIFYPNKKLFQNAYQINNYIFTHAGIQNYWFINRFKGNIEENIADQLNNPINKEQEEALHDVGIRRGGNKNVGGIFWCDKNELKKPLNNFIQIVGHTRVEDIAEYNWKNSKVYFIDTLQTSQKELILNI